ncbi:monocarboxylate transporter 12-like [Lineus longissimus]|uniref:monocarboxylate transporter 12-like n=1 Tax=Lineus longissimus TaxID=88925 RepID=UPI002B4EA8EA
MLRQDSTGNLSGIMEGSDLELDTLEGVQSDTTAASVGGESQTGSRLPPKTPPNRRRNQANVNSPALIHFGDHYPDNGWGWVICGAAFTVHCLAQGIHWSFGTFYMNFISGLALDDVDAVWLGCFSHSGMLLVSPIVTAICKRKSPRLLAVCGGIVSSLGCLFLSFSTEFYQHFISYGILALGTSITMTTANIMVGRYFKVRRELAELVVISGSGLGQSVMSTFAAKLIRVIGWMRVMQCFAGFMFLTFVSGCLYRSASLYHPRRKVILHMKNQKRPKTAQRDTPKPPYRDFRALRMRIVQVIVLSAALVSFGVYTPFIFVIKAAPKDLLEAPDLFFILPLLMGLSFVVGVLTVGYIVVQKNESCVVSRQYLCQITGIGCGAVSMMFPIAKDYTAHALCVTAYGLFIGAYYYSLKMLTYELVEVKVMERAWSYIMCAQSAGILVGTPTAVYLQQATNVEEGGFYFTGTCMILGSVVLYALPWARSHPSNEAIMDEVNAEAHNIDVTVAMIPEFFGFAQNEIYENIRAEANSTPVNSPVTASTPLYDRQQRVAPYNMPPNPNKPRHIRLKHKALNKLVQEINGHVNQAGCDLSWSSKTVQCVSERQMGAEGSLSPGVFCDRMRTISAPNVAPQLRDSALSSQRLVLHNGEAQVITSL